jgi:hypothetical protein
VGELLIKEETVPVIAGEQVVAVISRHRNAELMRSPSRLELTYREIAHALYRMVAEGNFPFPNANSIFDPAPRVGDGLIRLDVNGVISYASPNARSAFNRLGWEKELESYVLGDVGAGLSQQSTTPQEESVRSGLSGKAVRRVEVENPSGTIDLLVLPYCKVLIELVQLCFCTMSLNCAGEIEPSSPKMPRLERSITE